MLVKDQQKTQDFKFTGGENLSGLFKLYHEVMMLNELEGGYGAYKVSYAGEKSGISFGGNQMDMKGNKELARVFLDILRHAHDEDGFSIFSDEEIELIAGDDSENLVKIPKSLESVFGIYLSRVNEVLSSDYGRAKIDSLYEPEIKRHAEHVELVIANMENRAAQQFYDSILGRVLLFDYENQFGIDIGGRFLKDYINGDGKTDFTTKKEIISPKDVYLLEHHLQYIRSTKQYYKNPKSSDGRIDHIFQAVKKFNDVFMTVFLENPNDFAFTRDTTTGRWKVYPSLSMPAIPSFQGRQSFRLSFMDPIVANYFFLPNSNLRSPFKHNTFYYLAKSKQLFLVESREPVISYPGNSLDNNKKWEIHSIGLSAIEPKRHLQLPNYINIQDYVLYIIQVKKVPVERNELMKWLKNVIIEY